jgi:uncharacterized protein YeaO (DUF488 family)
MPGQLRETYHAALQHDLIDLPEDAQLVGVVRRPTGWFGAELDENRPALGPPEDLLDATKAAAERMEAEGFDETPAHNLAWQESDFESRYRDYLAESDAARRELDDLAARVRDGETVVLVCYEGDDKHCHRRILQEVLAELATADEA